MSEPITPMQRAQKAIAKRFEQMMGHLMMGDESTAKKNFKSMKREQEALEFAKFAQQAETDKQAEQEKLQVLGRLRGQRESSQAKIMEARRVVAKIEALVEALGENYSMMLRLADSAWAEAPVSEKPKVGHAKLKDRSLENALLVALQKAGVPVLKETDALRGQATLSDAFEIGARQITKKMGDNDDD